ncbi:sensor histidine kinase [Neptunitalea lumnitzerae]|uniref:Signal transduction histidine kinase internal region domain-containing protein n=1 Tax=Neptunitalea lumnitzerae TaxID=2965509 RepID=A0ABQ5MMH3_9FLAO|nr:histidine kinase [Neptunitalea sp. Y10]GLB50285.1 hypothetical protein Y10_26530 [Neptunitalea sp. Y10]
MISRLENKIVIYVSILLGLILNIHKLILLVPGEKLADRFWEFNMPELIYQASTNTLFSLLIGFYNLRYLKRNFNNRKNAFFWLGNLLLTLFCVFFAYKTQAVIFHNIKVFFMSFFGTMLRFGFTTFCMIILVRFMLLLEAKEEKERENKQLQEAYFNAEINNLKGQLNPHFLFNSLSNLSALVREDSNKAQLFITNLSKIFRYTLNVQNKTTVLLEEELRVLKAYAQLQEIRLEKGLQITIHVPQEYLQSKLPIMSLQPLLENVIKHNYASEELPLRVTIYIEDNYLVVKNNLQINNIVEHSSGVGLSNLAERYRLLYKEEILITQEEGFFMVSLPLEIK